MPNTKPADISGGASAPEQTEQITLDQVKPGYGGVITAVGGQGALRRRLLDMGIVEGTRVECLGMSPGGDPKAFLVRGAVLASRGQDCRDIIIYP